MSLKPSNEVVDQSPPTTKSKVTNRQDLFLERVDGRSKVARRYRDVYGQLVSDLGGDPSEAQNQVARRAATLAAWCEQQEALFVLGREFDITAYGTAANNLRRLLCTIGLERRAKDITPTIASYLRDAE
jgi:hypothetical protein